MWDCEQQKKTTSNQYYILSLVYNIVFLYFSRRKEMSVDVTDDDNDSEWPEQLTQIVFIPYSNSILFSILGAVRFCRMPDQIPIKGLETCTMRACVSSLSLIHLKCAIFPRDLFQIVFFTNLFYFKINGCELLFLFLKTCFHRKFFFLSCIQKWFVRFTRCVGF